MKDGKRVLGIGLMVRSCETLISMQRGPSENGTTGEIMESVMFLRDHFVVLEVHCT